MKITKSDANENFVGFLRQAEDGITYPHPPRNAGGYQSVSERLYIGALVSISRAPTVTSVPPRAASKPQREAARNLNL